MFGFWRRYWLRRQMRRQAAMGRQTTWLTVVAAPFNWLFRLPSAIFRSIGFSLRNWLDTLSGTRRSMRDLALGLPAVLIFLAFAAATAMGHLQQNGNGQVYWNRGEQALRAGDAKTAQIFLQKAMLSDRVSRRDVVFTLARSYEQTNDLERADALMSSLASIGIVGYPAAHRYLAIRTADNVAKTRRVDDLSGWHWHLTHADQSRSAPLQKAWGTYYLIGGDLENSAKHFRTAAEEEPAMWLQVAELEARMNDMEAVRRTLATARQRLEQQFIRDPGNAQNRLLYATSLFYMGELPQAETLLKQGLSEGDNASFRQLLAAVFVRMFDVEAASTEGMGNAFGFLTTALEYEPSYQPALSRLVTFARASEGKLDESRNLMRKLISDGRSSAMAHFTLGTLEWIAGNTELAQLNMKQAVAMDKKLPVIANNLAFLLAQSEEPDLDSALRLVDQAVESDPKNADFRDTRGMVLDRMGRTADAAIDYQAGLETAPDPRPFQLKLAELYERLGDPQLAARYRSAAAAPSNNSRPE